MGIRPLLKTTSVILLICLLAQSAADKMKLERFKRDAVSYESGTTQNFEDIFKGRCYEYGCLSCHGETQLDCQEVYDAFVESVLSAPTCSLEDDAYTDFIQMVAPNLPAGMTTFWSGTYEIAHDMSATTDLYYTMEDTFMGYLVNSLNWCGNDDNSDLGYDECPAWDYDDCYGQATSVFWNEASAVMARQAKGEVFVILNGDTTEGAFRESSFFGRVEAPNLNPNQVDVVSVLLIHDLDNNPYETCDDPKSLQNLWALLKDLGIPYTCEDDPANARFLQCSQDPDNPECSTTCENEFRKPKPGRGRFNRPFY